MDVNEIKSLIEAMGASDVAEMEVARDGWTLRLSRNHAARPPVSAPVPASAVPIAVPRPASAPRATPVVAPLSGVVYLAATPGGPPFVAVGSQVEAGAVLCVVEAMKIFNEIRAERAGTVTSILVATGAEVDAGQTLIEIG